MPLFLDEALFLRKILCQVTDFFAYNGDTREQSRTCFDWCDKARGRRTKYGKDV